ncbi:hypothetical protein BGX26_011536, partial [Mortierella sp. AD094]
MNAAELAMMRKESARVVLQTLLNKKPMSMTVGQYKTYLGLWQTFCNARYDGNTAVSPPRMLDFFVAVVFTQTVQKRVDPNAGYSGQ